MEVVDSVKDLLRPMARTIRGSYDSIRFQRRCAALNREYGDRSEPKAQVAPEAACDAIGAELRKVCGTRARILQLSLADECQGNEYWEKYGRLYEGVGNGREKALEHSLSLDLFDFSRVRRYCDVAASASPMENAVAASWPAVERWKQDCEFQPDPEMKILSGFAQKMDGVAAGFFDALTLHCSFEHFHGSADSEFVAEVDRVLSDRGACLILPLYLDLQHRIFFDPLRTSPAEVASYDAEALLCPTFDYRQKHGRYYSPASLDARVLRLLPPSLRATLFQFSGQGSVGERVYLQFGLVLHRPSSVFSR